MIIALKFLRSFCFFLMIAIGASGAKAQIAAYPSTSAEEVAIAMFKTANIKPDFRLWAKRQPSFKYQSITLVDSYLDEESTRLARRWQEYDPENATIQTTVKVEVGVERKENSDKTVNYYMHMVVPDQPTMVFPVVYQEYNIALIPQNMSFKQKIEIRKEQYEFILKNFKDAPSAQAQLHIGLKPNRAYLETPQNIDGLDMWAFFCQAVSFNLFTETGDVLLWSYTAEWYVSPKAKELKELYNNHLDKKNAESGPPSP